MTQIEEIKIARENAWSITPGSKPDGIYIGTERVKGVVFHYYKDRNNHYWYISSTTERVDAELKAAARRKAYLNRRKRGTKDGEYKRISAN
ncbi:MAG: hypothetical protein IJN64_10950 [Lachnospiraceae bacterium]|nr:hypothetical protein [Lachnospiraceae bacterium]